MITLSNKHSFEFMAASGALAFDGRGWLWEQPLRWAGLLKPELFTIVTKSLTLNPRRGNLRWWNPLRCVRLIRGGTVNAVGLTNPGVEEWVGDIYPRVAEATAKQGWSFVASIAGEDLQEYMEMAIRLKDCLGLKALEINASCPNSPSALAQNSQVVIDTAKALKYVAPWPLILKLSYTHDYVKIAKALEGVVEAISINSVPWPVTFPKKKSPLAKFGGGGVSGQAAQTFTWKIVRDLVRETSTPVIGAGVWEYGDIAKLFSMGAKAIAFGSIFLRYPWKPTRFVQKWRAQKNQ